MDVKQLEIWKEAVLENRSHLKTVADDRVLLKQKFIEHIKMFFDGYKEIEFSQNLDVVTVKWDWRDTPSIKDSNLERLEMNWEIGLDDGSILIRLFPFG